MKKIGTIALLIYCIFAVLFAGFILLQVYFMSTANSATIPPEFYSKTGEALTQIDPVKAVTHRVEERALRILDKEYWTAVGVIANTAYSREFSTRDLIKIKYDEYKITPQFSHNIITKEDQYKVGISWSFE